MGRSEQGLSEGLEHAGVLLELRSEHVGERVTVHVARHQAILLQLVPKAAALGVAKEIGLDTNQGVDVVHEAAAATEHIEAGDGSQVGVDVNERETYWDFKLGIVLRECRDTQQRYKCQYQN